MSDEGEITADAQYISGQSSKKPQILINKESQLLLEQPSFNSITNTTGHGMSNLSQVNPENQSKHMFSKYHLDAKTPNRYNQGKDDESQYKLSVLSA